MSLNQSVQTPQGQYQHENQQILTAVERTILERVLALSLEQAQTKAWKKDKGLSLKYRKLISNMKMTKSSQKCSICYSEFEEGQIIKKLPCRHIYHRDCAKSWLKMSKNCPNCRLDLQQHFQKLQKEGKLQQNQIKTIEKCKNTPKQKQILKKMQNFQQKKEMGS